jgi:hypothetical protein
MAKALLVNSAVDISGAPPIPNVHEGWGRVNATEIISSSVGTIHRDQLDVFDNTGENWTMTASIIDPSKPLKVTVSWADAPGAVSANPALVNDLDLTVEVGGSTYLGNVFSSGWSVTGGTADTRNNLENVYVQNPSGVVEITVDASNIAGDGIPISGDSTDQDFAIICYNCSLTPIPDINLSHSDLSASIEQGEMMTLTLTITNTGSADLDWTIIEGSAIVEGGCGTPGDLPWLSVSPTGGTTSPANSDDVAVVFDATGLQPGDYSGELCVTSNAPGNPELVVSLNLTAIQTEFFIFMPALYSEEAANATGPLGLLPLGGLLLVPTAVFGWRRRRSRAY